MPTWLIIAIAILVLIPLTILVVGGLLPGRFGATCSISTKASPEAAWQALLDHRKHPMSGRMCRGVEELPAENDLPAWREDLGSSRVKVVTIEQTKPERIVRRMQDEVVPMTMTCEYRIEPFGAACIIHAEGQGEIRSGTWHVPFFKFMIHVFGGAKSGQKQFLKSIQNTLESN